MSKKESLFKDQESKNNKGRDEKLNKKTKKNVKRSLFKKEDSDIAEQPVKPKKTKQPKKSNKDKKDSKSRFGKKKGVSSTVRDKKKKKFNKKNKNKSKESLFKESKSNLKDLMDDLDDDTLDNENNYDFEIDEDLLGEEEELLDHSDIEINQDLEVLSDEEISEKKANKNKEIIKQVEEVINKTRLLNFKRIVTTSLIVIFVVLLGFLGKQIIDIGKEDKDISTKITFPDLTNMSQETAEEILKRKGIESTIIPQYDLYTDGGNVIKVDKDFNKSLEKGETVTLFVSNKDVPSGNHDGKPITHNSPFVSNNIKVNSVRITNETVYTGLENLEDKDKATLRFTVIYRDTQNKIIKTEDIIIESGIKSKEKIETMFKISADKPYSITLDNIR